MKKEPLIVVAGPTAVGKSALAVELARRIGGEIISADSMQVYRYMDIGTAKITREEMMGVPHHMIDVVSPKEPFDAARYEEMTLPVIDEIRERRHLPILCGGTGFYIQAVTRHIAFGETETDGAYRQKLEEYAERNGNNALHKILRERDSEAASQIHPNNLRRVIRALEYQHLTGQKMSEHNAEEKRKESPYDLLFFYVDDDRTSLYARIDRRVDFMMEEGLLDEVRYLKAMGLTRNDVSMQGLGYKEMLDVLDGITSLEEGVRILKRDTRHFAKRQETWFAREKDTVKIETGAFGEDPDRIVRAMTEKAAEHYGLSIPV